MKTYKAAHAHRLSGNCDRARANDAAGLAKVRRHLRRVFIGALLWALMGPLRADTVALWLFYGFRRKT